MSRPADSLPFSQQFNPVNPADLWTGSSPPQLDAAPGQSLNKKKHVCATCQKAFTTSGHLSRHTRVHTGERNHKCPFPGCETRCSRQDNLQQHYRIHLSPGSRRTSGASARNSLSQSVMVISAHNGGVRKRALNSSSPAAKPVQVESPPSTPPPLEQAYIAPMLPPQELTTSHAFLTSRQPMQFDALGSTPQPIPQSSYPSHPQSASFSDLSYSPAPHMTVFDSYGPSAMSSQSLPSLGSMYQSDDSLSQQISYPPTAPIVGGHLSRASMSQFSHSNTPSPVPSTISISSHGSVSNGYYDSLQRGSPAMRPLDTNGLVYPVELSPSDRFQPPPISTAYMSLHALDTAHQTAASSWHTQTGGGRSIHGPSARLMRA